MKKYAYHLFYILAAASLCCCASPKVLSILTYNASHSMTDIKQYDDIANFINRDQPDIVSLQEIDFVTGQEDNTDAVAVFKRLSGKESGFTRNISVNESAKGVGILTDNHPLTSSSIPLPGEAGDPVALVHEYSDCVVVSVQFPYDEKSQLEGVALMDSIAEIFSPLHKPIIIAGTMPFAYGSAPFVSMSRNWGTLNDPQTPTYSSPSSQNADACFDYIWAYTGSGISYYVWQMDVMSPIISSSPHKPVIVTFRYLIPKKDR